jgi:hypothetical protein
MPPERARGEALTLSSDLWSLGATLFAAVEGRAPFHRSSPVATLAAVLTEDLPPTRHAGPLEPALTALLAKEPAERPTAEEARDLLRRAMTAPPPADQTGDVVGAWLAGGTVTEATQGLPPPRRPASPRGLVTAGAAVVAASLLLGVPTAALLIHHADSTSRSAAAPPAVTEFTGPSQEQPARAGDTAGPGTGQPVRHASSPSGPRSGGSAVTGVGYVQAMQSIPTPSAVTRERGDAGSEVEDGDDQGDDEGQGGKGEDWGAGAQEHIGDNGGRNEHGDGRGNGNVDGHGDRHGPDGSDRGAGRDDTGNHRGDWRRA